MTENSEIEIVEESAFPMTVQNSDVVEGQIISVMPMDVDGMIKTYKKMKAFVNSAMNVDIDFGRIPGVSKNSLYKPGAEKLQRFFGFSVKTECVHSIEQWETPVSETQFPLFHYRYVTTVYGHNGKIIATCEGETNSYELKYRWRWVSRDKVPAKYHIEDLDTQPGTEREPDFAIQKKETSGKYGKPAEYWAQWETDIAEKRAVKVVMKKRDGGDMGAWERDGALYRIPNEDIHSQVNTIMKIAQKRSYVGAVIIAANASEYFTQDVEDIQNIDVDVKSIKDFVPSKLVAAKELIRYTASLGITDAGNWINQLLIDSEIVWSLDRWIEIVELVKSHIQQ